MVGKAQLHYDNMIQTVVAEVVVHADRATASE